MSDDSSQKSELVRQRKRLAMGVDLDGSSYSPKSKSSGGKVLKFAKGGSVKGGTIDGSGTGLPAELSHQRTVSTITAYPEKGVDRLPAKGVTPKITKAVPHSIATMKKGGSMSKPLMKKNAGRGR